MTPQKQSLSIVLDLINARKNIRSEMPGEIANRALLVLMDLDILHDMLQNDLDKLRVWGTKKSAEEVIKNKGHMNFRKIADEKFMEIQQELIVLQEILVNEYTPHPDTNQPY